MKHIITILVASISMIANAASCFQVGMKWTVQYVGSHLSEPVYTTKILSLVGDTIVGDKPAIKMYSNYDEPNAIQELVAIIREENNKVYFWSEPTEDWYLMYDFTLQPGEGTVVYSTRRLEKDNIPFNSYMLCIDQHDDDMCPGHTVLGMEEYKVNDLAQPRGTGNWIDGIGSSRGVLENNMYYVDGMGSKLIEASINGTILYKSLPSGLNNTVSEPFSLTLKDNCLTVYGGNAGDTIHLHTIDGKKIATGTLTTGFFSISLPKGIFVISIGSYSKKIAIL